MTINAPLFCIAPELANQSIRVGHCSSPPPNSYTTTPSTAASFTAEFQEGNELAETVGGKLEAEKTNPRGK